VPKRPPSIWLDDPVPNRGLEIPRTFYLWASLALFVVGAELTWYNGAIVGRELRARSWPTTEAHIVSVATSDDSTGWLEGLRTLRPAAEMRYHVSYDYTVGGADYSGSRIGMRPGAARVAGQRDRFAVGRSFNVHYNPNNPDDSVIDARVPMTNVIGAAVGVLLLTAAIRMYRRTLRQSRAGNY
jgi:uncharacterized protein DUF3592